MSSAWFCLHLPHLSWFLCITINGNIHLGGLQNHRSHLLFHFFFPHNLMSSPSAVIRLFLKELSYPFKSHPSIMIILSKSPIFFSIFIYNSLLTSLLPFLYLPSWSVPCRSQRNILKTLIRSGHFYAQTLPLASKVFSFSASSPGILSQTLLAGLIPKVAFLKETFSDHPILLTK